MRTMEAIVYFKSIFEMRPVTLEYGDIYYHCRCSSSHNSLWGILYPLHSSHKLPVFAEKPIQP